MMRTKIGFVFFVLSIATRAPLLSQETRIPVMVSVGCDDKVIESELSSYVTRELRTLSDVMVYVDAPQKGGLISLDIAAVPNCGAGSVAISYAFWMRYYVSASEPPIGMFITHGVQTGPRTELKHLAETLVATFDSTALNLWRRQDQKRERSRPPKKKQ